MFLPYILVVIAYARSDIVLQAKYMGDEAKEKSGKNIDVNSWDMEFVEDLPQQKNGYITILNLL